jgi:hypothetical protein
MEKYQDSLGFGMQEAIEIARAYLDSKLLGEYLQAVEIFCKSCKDQNLGFSELKNSAKRVRYIMKDMPEDNVGDMVYPYICLAVMYHKLESEPEERKIQSKRREMKQWPLDMFHNQEAKGEALRTIKEAQEQKRPHEEMLQNYSKMLELIESGESALS